MTTNNNATEEAFKRLKEGGHLTNGEIRILADYLSDVGVALKYLNNPDYRLVFVDICAKMNSLVNMAYLRCIPWGLDDHPDRPFTNNWIDRMRNRF